MQQVDEPKEKLSATIAMKAGESVYPEDNLEFKGGSYGFVLQVYEDNLSVVIDETMIVQDEMTSFDCNIEKVKVGVKFCKKSLSFREQSEENEESSNEVFPAFTFSCVAK